MSLIIVAFYTLCDNLLIQNWHYTLLPRIAHSDLGYANSTGVWEILINLRIYRLPVRWEEFLDYSWIWRFTYH